ncbi:MAG TPA: HAD family hydrolase [Candidatus Acidoferrales bacterium]|nr:HAD family hydrolase [Candidatus Acidoferrales bacterium]
MSTRRERQTLLIDADDTLWETNLRFERTLAAFYELLLPLGYSKEYVLGEVDLAERARIPHGGYGEGKFLVTLEEVYRRLAGPRVDENCVEQIRALSRLLHEAPLRILDGVRETLAYLAPRHNLLMFTKGDAEEQASKVEASGLGDYFALREIVPEKNEEAYRALVERTRLNPAEVWMVGDSPRSDINPALAVGLNAVYIPSAHKWEYEHEDIRPGNGRLLILESFRELRVHF